MDETEGLRNLDEGNRNGPEGEEFCTGLYLTSDYDPGRRHGRYNLTCCKRRVQDLWLARFDRPGSECEINGTTAQPISKAVIDKIPSKTTQALSLRSLMCIGVTICSLRSSSFLSHAHRHLLPCSSLPEAAGETSVVQAHIHATRNLICVGASESSRLFIRSPVQIAIFPYGSAEANPMFHVSVKTIQSLQLRVLYRTVSGKTSASTVTIYRTGTWETSSSPIRCSGRVLAKHWTASLVVLDGILGDIREPTVRQNWESKLASRTSTLGPKRKPPPKPSVCQNSRSRWPLGQPSPHLWYGRSVETAARPRFKRRT